MSGNAGRWDRVIRGDCTPVIGAALAKRVGTDTNEMVPVFLVRAAEARKDLRDNSSHVWMVRCPRCGKTHRFAPRVGLHPSQCPHSLRWMTEGGDWTGCYLVRHESQAMALPAFREGSQVGTLCGAGL